MLRDQDRYVSYLLRLWQAEEGDQVVWRASLVNTIDNQRRNFSSVEALIKFLEDQFITSGVKPSSEE